MLRAGARAPRSLPSQPRCLDHQLDAHVRRTARWPSRTFRVSRRGPTARHGILDRRGEPSQSPSMACTTSSIRQWALSRWWSTPTAARESCSLPVAYVLALGQAGRTAAETFLAADASKADLQRCHPNCTQHSRSVSFRTEFGYAPDVPVTPDSDKLTSPRSGSCAKTGVIYTSATKLGSIYVSTIELSEAGRTPEMAKRGQTVRRPPAGRRRPTKTKISSPKIKSEIGNADLKRELAKARRELTEARQQQTATSEVLRVISSSPGEVQPVFNAMLENATRTCANICINGDCPSVAIHGAVFGRTTATQSLENPDTSRTAVDRRQFKAEWAKSRISARARNPKTRWRPNCFASPLRKTSAGSILRPQCVCSPTSRSNW